MASRTRKTMDSRSDCMQPEQRRKAMQSNRGRTGPERAFAASLWREGFRYLTSDGYRTLHGTRFPGQPDLIFTRMCVVIFVDGCFWHGCSRCHDFAADCNLAWQRKIEANRKRDHRVTMQLRRAGWRVIRIWEHGLRKASVRACIVHRVVAVLSKLPKLNKLCQGHRTPPKALPLCVRF